MPTFADGLRAGLKNAYCSNVANSPQWFSNLRGVLVSGDLRERADNLYRWVCDVPPDEPAGVSPPFLGGQCAGVQYEVWGEVWQPFSSVWAASDRIGGSLALIEGPVTGLGLVQTTLCSAGGFDGKQTTVRATGGPSGSTVLDIPRGCVADGPGGIPGIRNLTLVRSDGSPDDCGDPPIDLPPPGDIIEDVDITYNDGDDVEYNLTVPVIFAPFYVSFNGELKVPITIGDLNFNGEIGFEPEFNIDVDFGTGDQQQPTVDDPDVDPPGNPEFSEPIEPNGPESAILGVHVRATAIGDNRATQIDQAAAPDILAPRCANVVFAIKTGSVSGWTGDIPVKSVQAFVPCPVSWGAVDVRVTAETGFTVSFTPVRGRPLAPFEP